MASYFKLFSIIIATFTVSCSAMASSSRAGPVKAAYYPSWAADRFPPSAINTSLFTHIYYAFVLPNNITFEFQFSNETASSLQDFTSSLSLKSPAVKTLLSIGGGGSDPLLFAHIASGADSRKRFVNSAVNVARRFGFDGLDLDWEFPQDPTDMENLGLLFADWRLAIENEAKANHRRTPLLLTAAVYYSADITLLGGTPRSYPVPAINQNLDWVNAMCFDYRGSWDTTATGAHAALYDPNGNLSTSFGLGSWIKAGVIPKKLVMGLPVYGKSWRLKDPSLHRVGSPAIGVGPGDDGILIFSEILKFNKEKNTTVVYDVDTVSTYSYIGTTWIGYDDPVSTNVKVGYAKLNRLLGYFFWALSYDSEWKISTEASQTWDN